MSTQTTVGTDERAVETAQSRSEQTHRRLWFPLRLKFLVLIFFISILPVGSILSLYLGFGPIKSLPVALMIGVSGILIGTILYERFMVSQVHTLLVWVRRQRRDGFKNTPVISVNTPDEIGELSREISLSTAYFLELRDRSEIVLRQKRDFLTIVEHQLRTPVNRLSWAVEAVLRPDQNEQEREQMFLDIQVLLKRMTLVINNMLNSMSIEEGKFGYLFERIDIVPMIEKLLKDFTLLAQRREIAIEFKNPGDIAPVYIDANRLLLALFNLIMNAVDYTPVGGSVTVSLMQRENGVEIVVEDSGIGIPKEDLEHLFARFYRSSNAKSMRPDGSGLGLYIVRNVAREHGSDVIVESQEGKGARFSFLIPFTKEIRSKMIRSLPAI